MQTISAREAEQGFGRLLATAQRGPVMIEDDGRPVAVVMAREEYERLEAQGDAYWGARALEAEKEGYFGPEAGEELLQELLSAED